MPCIQFDHFVDVCLDLLRIVTSYQIINLSKEVLDYFLTGSLKYVYFIHFDSVVADSRMWKRGALAPLRCFVDYMYAEI